MASPQVYAFGKRNEELALLTPVERGKYLQGMEKLRHQMMKPKRGKAKKETGEQEAQ